MLSACAFWAWTPGLGFGALFTSLFREAVQLLPVLKIAILATLISHLVPMMTVGDRVLGLSTLARKQKNHRLTIDELEALSSRSVFTAYSSGAAGLATFIYEVPVLLVMFGNFADEVPYDKKTLLWTLIWIPILHGLINAHYVEQLRKAHLVEVSWGYKEDEQRYPPAPAE